MRTKHPARQRTKPVQVSKTAYTILSRWKRKSGLPMARIVSEAVVIANKEWCFAGGVQLTNAKEAT